MGLKGLAIPARPTGATGLADTRCRAVPCHSVTAWEPARFDHDRLFRLDGDHNVACATCHGAKRFDSYTCYSCHEHKPAQTLALRREEGIGGKISNCSRCHRSAEGEPGEGGRGPERGGDDD